MQGVASCMQAAGKCRAGTRSRTRGHPRVTRGYPVGLSTLTRARYCTAADAHTDKVDCT